MSEWEKWMRALLDQIGTEAHIKIDRLPSAASIVDWKFIETFPDRHPYVTSLLLGLTGYGLYVGSKRYKTAMDVPSRWVRRHQSFRAKVILVNDSDGLRVYHLPLLYRLFPFYSLSGIKNVKDTINIRLAGMDAPEGAHFGQKGQPYYQESKAYLKRLVEGKTVTCTIRRIDMYQRAVCSVTYRKWGLWKHDVSLDMVKAGFAVVYRESGAEYGGHLPKLERAEAEAKKRGLGMWQQLKSGSFESPAEYKRKQKSE